jgi:riboflavin synthase
MFTGIVEEIGTVKSLTSDNLAVQSQKLPSNLQLGDSISVNGVCLTVIKTGDKAFTVEIMPETKRLTNIGSLRPGDKVNLERALSATGRFGGHFVQGHVDGTGKLITITEEERAIIAGFATIPEISHYLVKKCFIAVNGVSLTVVNCTKSQFSVSLVTFTRENTNLGLLKKGNLVNLEVDIIAKYIEKLYSPGKESRLHELLTEYDYLNTR